MKSDGFVAQHAVTLPPQHFLDDALKGLGSSPKRLPCKYLYDARGSCLFEEICGLPEYYLTRTELAILEQARQEIARAMGHGCLLIEYGSGSSRKTRVLLDAAHSLAGYVPVDISATALRQAYYALRARYPRLAISPLCADYTRPETLRAIETLGAKRRVVFFPGSTIGNFSPRAAREFLAQIAQACTPSGGVLIGVDLKKDPRVLCAAYNDARGVTAAFNLNVLWRMNRELGADFSPERFVHYAYYSPRAGRVEMHLVSLVRQSVHLGEARIDFAPGETIWTESSYKYTLEEFDSLARQAGLHPRARWTDSRGLFSVHYLEVGA